MYERVRTRVRTFGGDHVTSL